MFSHLKGRHAHLYTFISTNKQSVQLEHLRGCISQAHEILIVTHYSVLSLIMAFRCFAIRLCTTSVRYLLDWSSSYIRFQEEVDIKMFSADVLEAADGSSVANVGFV